MMAAARPAVVLFSGGLDSSTCLAIARAEGFAPHALSVRYGQRHESELAAAGLVAQAMQVPLKIVGLDLRHTPSVEAFCRRLLATRGAQSRPERLKTATMTVPGAKLGRHSHAA